RGGKTPTTIWGSWRKRSAISPTRRRVSSSTFWRAPSRPTRAPCRIRSMVWKPRSKALRIPSGSVVRLSISLLALPCLGPTVRASAEDYSRLAEEVLQSVRDHFYDGKRAHAWADSHKGYGGGIDDRRAFAKRTN